jgi:transcriptional regulator with XRE-family HTH domain
MTPASRIRLSLRRLGWSKARLGRELGISQPTASHLANGIYPGFCHFPKIARLLDVPEDWLRTGYPEPPWVAPLVAGMAPEESATFLPAPAPLAPPPDEATLVRQLAESERERDALRLRVRRLEGTIAWQAEQLQALHTGQAGAAAAISAPLPVPEDGPTVSPAIP